MFDKLLRRCAQGVLMNTLSKLRGLTQRALQAELMENRPRQWWQARLGAVMRSRGTGQMTQAKLDCAVCDCSWIAAQGRF